jgi:hypothetical protein
MRIANCFAILLAAWLAGCATNSASSGFVRPSARCMRTSVIPHPKVGEESTAYSARLITHSKSEMSKTRCLQRWANTVSN